MLGWIWLLLSVARAAAPVLYTGDPAAAEARVRKEARLKGELTLQHLVDLAPGASPYVIGEPPPLRCSPGRLENVRKGVENAQADLSRDRDAVNALELARLDLECLGEAVDPGLAAQLFYLRGFLAWRQGNNSSAESAFYRAFLFSPMVTWDEAMGGPHPAAPFSAAERRARGYDRATLRVVPDPAPDFTLRIDGQPVEPEGGRIELLPGVHLIQVLADGHVDQPLVVPLDTGQEKVLVLPVALSEAMLGRLDDAGVRDSLGLLLRAAWPQDTAWVTGPAGTWSYDPATGDWAKR